MKKLLIPLMTVVVKSEYFVFVLFFCKSNTTSFSSNGNTSSRNNAPLSATGSVIDVDNTKLSSSPPQRKLEVGSPISSSLSSHSRSKMSISSHHHHQVKPSKIVHF